MTTSITDAIATEQYSHDELAVIFATTTLNIMDLQKQYNSMVNDDTVSSREFDTWCERIDQEYKIID